MDETTKEILIILQEEAIEVAHEVSKIMRFGPDQIKPGTEITNMQALQKEIGDLQAMVEFLVKRGVGVNTNGISKAKKEKLQRLVKWSTIPVKG